ncbi:phytase [Vulcaniibacterium tengchongense]|uniref:3-phytase n=1 Tax=Vulcaniibacterium tengchongense TaxID=1273429 RepID=A0A3N4VP20_9GAMM|nr:phytase [Vulcaniibacterium tengchongense]RPE80971.1 3-phytase [Vulcaniibacterium tengchongense]
MTLRAFAVSLLAAVLPACTSAPPAPPAPSADGPREVLERYVSAAQPEALGALATWPAEDGGAWLIAAAPAADRLLVFDADSGARLRTVGARGRGPGRFLRPAGVAAFGERLFVAERGNRRVQVLGLPDFAPLGSFGEAELHAPDALWVDETAPDELRVYVVDADAPEAGPGRRVHRYVLGFDEDGRARARHLGAFGDRGTAALRGAAAIAGDDASGRLLLADAGAHGTALRAYRFDGGDARGAAPALDGAAAGLALWACPDGSGYWIAAERRAARTGFRLFDRAALAPRGGFRGETVAGTGAIAVHAAATAAFPFGALFAVHDDHAVAAFDLAEVARVLDLPPGCLD